MFSDTKHITGWWFQIFFLIFTPKIGEMIQIDEHIFQLGWNHQLEKVSCQEGILPVSTQH